MSSVSSDDVVLFSAELKLDMLETALVAHLEVHVDLVDGAVVLEGLLSAALSDDPAAFDASRDCRTLLTSAIISLRNSATSTSSLEAAAFGCDCGGCAGGE